MINMKLLTNACALSEKHSWYVANDDQYLISIWYL
ncbi:unnamed protein product [Acanthoscelides obtectus]|uniref:Uncharacterized protein n=1 Tax=Acanthoscelides obtectus TaxID=200917 RepID=A0A9P0P1J7_ACAOB|nr:unnamed protein product [Acanthoscelides obtectus]CAK1648872.1 hypothetical protein AOBTE_LOCUS15939 [Acanthoscelides obtectus]